jgi:hypothetical protein
MILYNSYFHMIRQLTAVVFSRFLHAWPPRPLAFVLYPLVGLSCFAGYLALQDTNEPFRLNLKFPFPRKKSPNELNDVSLIADNDLSPASDHSSNVDSASQVLFPPPEMTPGSFDNNGGPQDDSSP